MCRRHVGVGCETCAATRKSSALRIVDTQTDHERSTPSEETRIEKLIAPTTCRLAKTKSAATYAVFRRPLRSGVVFDAKPDLRVDDSIVERSHLERAPLARLLDPFGTVTDVRREPLGALVVLFARHAAEEPVGCTLRLRRLVEEREGGRRIASGTFDAGWYDTSIAPPGSDEVTNVSSMRSI